jgi:hypothetical protein
MAQIVDVNVAAGLITPNNDQYEVSRDTLIGLLYASAVMARGSRSAGCLHPLVEDTDRFCGECGEPAPFEPLELEFRS